MAAKLRLWGHVLELTPGLCLRHASTTQSCANLTLHTQPNSKLSSPMHPKAYHKAYHKAYPKGPILMPMPLKVSHKVPCKVSHKESHKVCHNSALPTLNCASQTQHLPPSNLSWPTLPHSHPYRKVYLKAYPKVCHKSALPTLSCASQTQHMLPSSLNLLTLLYLYSKVHNKICPNLLLEPIAMQTDSTQPQSTSNRVKLQNQQMQTSKPTRQAPHQELSQPALNLKSSHRPLQPTQL